MLFKKEIPLGNIRKKAKLLALQGGSKFIIIGAELVQFDEFWHFVYIFILAGKFEYFDLSSFGSFIYIRLAGNFEIWDSCFSDYPLEWAENFQIRIFKTAQPAFYLCRPNVLFWVPYLSAKKWVNMCASTADRVTALFPILGFRLL